MSRDLDDGSARAPRPRGDRWRLAIGVVAGLLALVLTGLWWMTSRPSHEQGEAVPVYTPGASSTVGATGGTSTTGTPGSTGAAPGATASSTAAGTVGGGASAGTTGSASATNRGSAAASTASSSASVAGCGTGGTAFVPTHVSIGRMGVSSPVLSLGLAGDGSAATPPFSQPQSMGWYDLGPRPGSSQGKVTMTAHTFHKGGALGNKLYDKDSGLRAGDIIKLSDGSGHVQCYRYTNAVKVWVKDYDPKSDVVYSTTGAPQLDIVVCWDYDGSTWQSRIVFYGTPIG